MKLITKESLDIHKKEIKYKSKRSWNKHRNWTRKCKSRRHKNLNWRKRMQWRKADLKCGKRSEYEEVGEKEN